MTKQDFEIKLAAAKKNTVLPEKQREQAIALYTRKIAEFEAADKKPDPKATVKKAEPVKTETKKPEPKSEPKKDSKKIDYNCDELIAKAKKAKAAAKERAAAPKKTEVTKSKETIERVHDKVQKNVEAGKFGKAQLQKLITETEDLLTFLKKTLKSL